jgi:glycosyltransferase involved in cell wall biosynthesis
MRLVMLTNSYPYGDQEAFIEPEMKSLEKLFDDIHILTLASDDAPITRYIPSNAKVTRVCEQNKTAIRAFSQLLTPSAIREIRFASQNYDYSLRNCVGLFLRFYGRAYCLLKSYLEQEEQDNTIFYSYWLSHLSYALMRYKKDHPNAFCISRTHRVDNFINFKASLFRREILSTLNGVYPISEEGKKELEQKVLPYIETNHAELKVFHLGVEFKDIVNPIKSQSEFQIASCSFIHGIKRLDIIIDALARIDDIPIFWTHFGGGTDEEKIKAMAEAKLGGKNNIRFRFAGQTAHDDILKYYTENHVDLFINSSDHEGIPVSVMEAMAAGIVCVARDVGGNRELIINRDNGFLLEKDAGASEYMRLIEEVYRMDDNTLLPIKQNAMSKIRADFESPGTYDRFAEYLFKAYSRA